STAGRKETPGPEDDLGQYRKHPVYLWWCLRRYFAHHCQQAEYAAPRLCYRPGRNPSWKVGQRQPAEVCLFPGPEDVRPHPRTYRSPSGCVLPQPTRQGGATPHPDRTEKRTRKTVQKTVRDGK